MGKEREEDFNWAMTVKERMEAWYEGNRVKNLGKGGEGEERKESGFPEVVTVRWIVENG